MAEHEQWDIVSGVGITALAVAAARAAETRRGDALIRDPFAASFVRAADVPADLKELFALERYDTAIAGDSVVSEAVASDPIVTMSSMATMLGVRSRYFDDYFASAARQGIRQAVILAAGLDARALRLAWPAGFVVYEIDQPKVLEFKDKVLADEHHESLADRRTVPVDLRDDWASALLAAGFDPSQPTAWLAEGLLPYLPADAERDLLATIDRYSPTGSQVAIEYFTDAPAVFRLMDSMESFDFMGIRVQDLMEREHCDPVEWLTKREWRVETETVTGLSARFDRKLGGPFEIFGANGGYLTAIRD